MREYEVPLVEEFKKGLIPFSNRPRNAGGLTDCFNVFPDDEGIKSHEEIISLNSATKDWGVQESLVVSTDIRDVVINIKNYVDVNNIEGAMVYIDGVLRGTTDIDGELTVTDLSVGGHSLQVSEAGYIYSADDHLLNDYFVVI